MLSKRRGQPTRPMKRVWSAGTIVGGLVASLGAAACRDSDSSPIVIVEPPIITVSPPVSTIAVGDSVRLVVTTTGAAAASLEHCSSSAPSVASTALTQMGCTAIGQSAGTAVITIATKSGAIVAASVTVVR